MISLLLAKKIGEMFLILGMGALLVRVRLLKEQDAQGLSVLMLYLVMPCVILKSYQIDRTPEVLRALAVSLGVGIAAHLALLLAMRLIAPILKLDPVERVSMIYSNASNLIVPIIVSVLDAKWVIYSLPFVSVQLVLLWTHCRSTLSGGGRMDLKKILLNVNMIAIVAGFLMFLTGIRLPQLVNDTLGSVGAMIGPMAMLTTGILIGSMNLARAVRSRRLWLVVALRLIAMPLLILLLLKLSGVERWIPNGETILMISFLATTTPAASTIVGMSQIYGLDAKYAGMITAMSTLLCIVTMPAMVWLYQRF